MVASRVSLALCVVITCINIDLHSADKSRHSQRGKAIAKDRTLIRARDLFHKSIPAALKKYPEEKDSLQALRKSIKAILTTKHYDAVEAEQIVNDAENTLRQLNYTAREEAKMEQQAERTQPVSPASSKVHQG